MLFNRDPYSTLGAAFRQNPDYAAKYMDERRRLMEQQLAQQQLMEGRGYMSNLMGSAPVMEEQMGPPAPGEASMPMQVAQEGTGYLGGQMDDRELLARMTTSPFAGHQEMAAEMFKSRMAPATLSPGQQRFDAAGNVLAAVDPTQTDMQRKLDLYAQDPGAFGQMYDAGVFGKPTEVNVPVSMGDQLRTVEEEARVADLTAQYDAARERVGGAVSAAREAQSNIGDIDYALDLLDKVKTGKGQALVTSAMQLADFLNIQIDQEDLANREALQARLGDEVMARVAETKGAVSEKEMDLFTQYSANFGKTPEGNRRILRFKRAKYERDIEVGKLIRRMRKAGKTSSEIDEAVDNYVAENDLTRILTRPERAAPADLREAARAELARRRAARQ